MRELPEALATAGGCSDCWKPWRVAGDACNMTENALSILIVIFLHNSNKPKRRTESNLFSDLAIGDIATQIADIAAPNDDVATSSANIVASKGECLSVS